MDYSSIPLIIIVASLALIVIVIIRKFPQLSLLDVESLPEVKEERKKEEFMKRRVAERTDATAQQWIEALAPVTRWLKKLQLSFRQFVGNVEKKAVKRMQEKQNAKPLDVQYQAVEEMKSMLAEAHLLFDRGDFEGAEAKYIAAIKIDPKRGLAYQGLADVYAAQKQWKEAMETYQFLLHLDPKSEHALVKLAEIAEQEGKFEEAVQYYEQAVLVNDNKSSRFWKIADLEKTLGHLETAISAIEQAIDLEPENPKYLDFLIEASILVGDKKRAESAFQLLRMVNPDNQKLPALKDKIELMVS